MKKIFLAWKSYCTRSHNIAGHVGAENVFILPFASEKSAFGKILRYAVSFILTLKYLFKERPPVVFTLNQPPPLIFAVYLYSRMYGAKYILDSHSGPFNDPKWAWFLPGYRFIAKNAFLNINTNSHHKEIVESWGGRSCIIGDVPIDFKTDYPRKVVSEKSIAVVASFMFDEPLEAVWEAAELLPDVTFHVTGNHKKAGRKLLETVPDNIKLEGYMERDEYLGLFLSVKGVMALTTRDFTMQMGAYEALSLEQPIITSDWAILRESFGNGAVYVDNTPQSIASGCSELLNNHDRYSTAIIKQRRIRRTYFDKARDYIQKEIERGAR